MVIKRIVPRLLGAGLVFAALGCASNDEGNQTEDDPPPKAAPSVPVDREQVPDVSGQLRRPASEHDINRAAIHKIKAVETLQLTAYQGLQHVLIGYGHAGTARPGMTITEAEADALLVADIQTCEAAVERTIEPFVTNNQFSAMVSLCFNIGETAFSKSLVAKLTNEGRFEDAANAFRHWRKSRGKVRNSLTHRREFERTMYLADAKFIVANPPAETLIAAADMPFRTAVKREVPAVYLASLRPALGLE